MVGLLVGLGGPAREQVAPVELVLVRVEGAEAGVVVRRLLLACGLVSVLAGINCVVRFIYTCLFINVVI